MHLDHMMRSPNITVCFAGFRGNLLELQNKGWQVSAYESLDPREYRHAVQIMLNHDGGGVTMATQLTLYRHSEIFEALKHQLEAQVVGLTIGGRSSFMQSMVKPIDIDFSARAFAPVDCTPSFERIDLSSIDLRKFGVFKKLNDVANIFLPEKTISELMDDILRKQGPKQAEIRQNRRREAFMQEFNRNPNEEIKLQLVAV